MMITDSEFIAVAPFDENNDSQVVAVEKMPKVWSKLLKMLLKMIWRSKYPKKDRYTIFSVMEYPPTHLNSLTLIWLNCLIITPNAQQTSINHLSWPIKSKLINLTTTHQAHQYQINISDFHLALGVFYRFLFGNPVLIWNNRYYK